MPKSEIIVMGASAGGVEALQALVAGLPPDLPAALFVVLHIGKGITGRSELPRILERAGPLRAKHPVDGEMIQHSTIYVAPPDRHLLVSAGHMHLSHGPKENRTRPAINPLFRSAARAYDGRVAGVVLTGLLDDGVAGLAEIKRGGGMTIVQEPTTAQYPSMPLTAIRRVSPDYILPLDAIAGTIAHVAVAEHAAIEREEPMERTLTELTCPECRGPLWEERQGSIVEYRCRVGHAYSPLAIVADHEDTVERTLWSTVVALEEAADIAERLAPELRPEAAVAARKRREHVAAVKKILEERPALE